jgi:thiamine biosynthesis protein ThiI
VEIAVHYAEIALKGRNRPRFEGALRHNVARSLSTLGRVHVRPLPGRLLVELPDGVDFEAAAERLRRVFGIAYFGRVTACEPTPEAIGKTAEDLVSARAPRSFGVRARRADKRHPFTSGELAREVGARIVGATGAKVDLTEPELWVEVHVLAREALVFHERHPGPGGMPVGVAGNVVAMISGGIDSPVAAFLMMKRGCRVEFVHFHSSPFTSAASIDKVRDLVEILSCHQGRSRLHLVPFAGVQQAIVRDAPAEPRIVLYRRFMVRIAEAIAEREGALALATGESLGQVSSQTLANLDTINRVARLPMLRPLVAMDKGEIVDRARGIGTYDVSIEPDEDCCAYLMPQHPATWTRPEEIEAAEEGIDVEALVKTTLEGMVTETVEPL